MSIVAIVGSMRFRKEMDDLERQLIRVGETVLAPTHAFSAMEGELTDKDREALQLQHLAKVRLADRVAVVAPGNYIGESVKQEIALAESLGKPISYAVL